MAHAPAHPPRFVPAQTNGGWGAVALVVLLMVICIVVTFMIYQRTYKHPTDPTWHAIGGANSKAPAH